MKFTIPIIKNLDAPPIPSGVNIARHILKPYFPSNQSFLDSSNSVVFSLTIRTQKTINIVNLQFNILSICQEFSSLKPVSITSLVVPQTSDIIDIFLGSFLDNFNDQKGLNYEFQS